jgi:hypothetical protein
MVDNILRVKNSQKVRRKVQQKYAYPSGNLPFVKKISGAWEGLSAKEIR